MPKVFISYTHDSPEHRAKVLALAQQLRRDAVDAIVDAYILGHPEEGWQLWMDQQMGTADFVLLVCTEVFYRRFIGREDPDKGLGSIWESNITRDHLYTQQGRNRKFIPVLFEGGSTDHIPEVLRSRYTKYVLPHDYKLLLRYIYNRPKVVPAPLGKTPDLPVDNIAEDESERELFSRSIREQMALLDRHVEYLTHDQFRVIRQLRGLRRVRITGCPGSGKTLVAVEKAIRLAEAGISTLVLCHNPLLAHHLRGLVTGTGVAVESFVKWVTIAAGESGNVTDGPWTHFDEVDWQTLDKAFGILTDVGPRYDAIIVDEGQDFRPEWWTVVEAALDNCQAAILYVFHDDHQSLLSFRTEYPVEGPSLDLSRNCRNGGRVYDLLQKVSPVPPAPEELLGGLGDAVVLRHARGEVDQRYAIQQGLRWISESGLLNSTVVLYSGSDAQALASPGTSFVAEIGSYWQQAVRHVFARVRAIYDQDDLFGPFLASYSAAPFIQYDWNKLWKLPFLSTASTPQQQDVQLVREYASQFKLRPTVMNKCRRLRWIDNKRQIVLMTRGGVTPNLEEVILHLQRKDWHDGLPQSRMVRVRSHEVAGPGEIPAYSVAAFKGLEADAVLLTIAGPAADLVPQVYVGISRARLLLAIVCEGETLAKLPFARALRRLSYEDEYIPLPFT